MSYVGSSPIFPISFYNIQNMFWRLIMIPYQIKDVDGYPGYKVDTLGNVYGRKGKIITINK